MKKLSPVIILALIISSCVKHETKSSKKNKPEEPAENIPSNPAPKVGTDPLAQYQWHLNNTGSNYIIGSKGKRYSDINLGNLHSQGRDGTGIYIAISDSDIQSNHEDLYQNFSINLSRNYKFQNPNSRSPFDANDLGDARHGTAVAGFIGATMNNAVGGKGVAPKATIAGFNYLSVNTTPSTTYNQASGSFDIFNFSYGYPTCMILDQDSSFISAVKLGVETQRSGKGSIYVKAAGNEYSASVQDCSPLSPQGTYFGNANYDPDNTTPYTIIVAALDSDGNSSQFSTPGANIWISAPGGGNYNGTAPLVTTDVTGCTHGYSTSNASSTFEKGSWEVNSQCNYTANGSGTSYAAPIVSGAIALILQANPSLRWRDVKYILAKTAKTIGLSGARAAHPSSDTTLSLSGHDYDKGLITNYKGFKFDNYYGFGALDLQAAVTMAMNYNKSLGDFIDKTANSNVLNRTIPDNSATGASYELENAHILNIESIELTINTTGASVSDLGIELTSPSGTTATVTNINSNIITENFVETKMIINAFYAEAAQGGWTLKVIDGKETPGQDAKLKSFSLKFYGTVNEI